MEAITPFPYFKGVLLFFSLILSGCALIYELILAGFAVQFFGDPVFHFAWIITFFLTGLGCGAFQARHIKSDHRGIFILMESFLALLGGAIPFLICLISFYPPGFYPFLTLLTLGISFISGMEIPVLTFILKEQCSTQRALSDILGMDYLGSFLATLAFSFYLLPEFGFLKSALLVGSLNLGIGFFSLIFFRREILNPLPTLGFQFLLALIFSISFLKINQWSDYLSLRGMGSPLVNSGACSPSTHFEIRDRGGKKIFFLNGSPALIPTLTDSTIKTHFPNFLASPGNKGSGPLLVVGGDFPREIQDPNLLKNITFTHLFEGEKIKGPSQAQKKWEHIPLKCGGKRGGEGCFYGVIIQPPLCFGTFQSHLGFENKPPWFASHNCIEKVIIRRGIEKEWEEIFSPENWNQVPNLEGEYLTLSRKTHSTTPKN